MRNRIAIFSAVLLCSIAWGQSQDSSPNSTRSNGAASSTHQSMPGMDMSGDSEAGMPKNGTDPTEGDASAHAMHSMEGHMDMGPHMKMTALRSAKPGDAERAKQVAEAARKASEKYLDY